MEFQSTRPRGARRQIDEHKRQRKVSIHAPTWGATIVSDVARNMSKVSIHAPTWGATCTTSTCIFLMPCRFNPRAHVGRDQKISQISKFLSVFQSTRPRGARLANLIETINNYKVSIHAPTWGATFDIVFVEPSPEFQSTRPRGARLQLSATTTTLQVSIHAPTWGATAQVQFIRNSTSYAAYSANRTLNY